MNIRPSFGSHSMSEWGAMAPRSIWAMNVQGRS